MTLLRPLSVAALLVMMPAPVIAADASPQAPANPPPQAGEGSLPSPLAAQSLDRLSATRERPLFSPTRRPPPPPPQVVAAPAPPPPPAPPPNVALFGIVMDGEEARAVVRAGPTEKIRRVAIGDDIGGWKVAQIAERQLVLALDGRIATIVMFTGNSANAAPPAQAPPAGRHSQAQAQPPNQTEQSSSAPANPQPSGPRRVRTPR